MATLSEFTVLQRLFRLALSGHLGQKFPIEALAELHREVAPANPIAPVRTLRWDSRPGQLELGLHVLVDQSLAAMKGSKASQAAGICEALSAIAALTAEYKTKVAEREKRLTAIESSGGASSEWDVAWEAFQSWDREWESRLEKAAKVLAAVCERAAVGNSGDPKASKDAKREDRPSDLADAVRHYTSAIAMRRALDVAADDKQARFEQGRSRPINPSSIARASH